MFCDGSVHCRDIVAIFYKICCTTKIHQRASARATLVVFRLQGGRGNDLDDRHTLSQNGELCLGLGMLLLNLECLGNHYVSNTVPFPEGPAEKTSLKTTRLIR